MKKISNLYTLRVTGVIIALIGAVVSLNYTLRAGRNNPSVLLIVFFVVWVLSPFAVMAAANSGSIRQWKLNHRDLVLTTIFLTIGSLLVYSGALIPTGTKPASRFLVVPLISWIILAAFMRNAARPRRVKRF